MLARTIATFVILFALGAPAPATDLRDEIDRQVSDLRQHEARVCLNSSNELGCRIEFALVIGELIRAKSFATQLGLTRIGNFADIRERANAGLAKITANQPARLKRLTDKYGN